MNDTPVLNFDLPDNKPAPDLLAWLEEYGERLWAVIELPRPALPSPIRYARVRRPDRPYTCGLCACWTDGLCTMIVNRKGQYAKARGDALACARIVLLEAEGVE